MSPEEFGERLTAAYQQHMAEQAKREFIATCEAGLKICEEANDMTALQVARQELREERIATAHARYAAQLGAPPPGRPRAGGAPGGMQGRAGSVRVRGLL
ncbi:MAG TPA: hypothetical protein VGH27_01610 [Streptosporangiaceae bacterium]|jgi:hypothetical protein